MARIRSIKPEYWTDSKIVKLSPLARLLFIGLWNFADDDGRMPFQPLTIKLQILPLDPSDLSAELGELRRESLITVYSVSGKEYLQVNNFDKHQKVDKRTASKLPPPPPNPTESPRETPSPPDGVEWKGRERKGADGTPTAYAFEGSLIRLTATDLEKIKKAYHTFPDIVAELTAIDAKFSTSPPKEWWNTLHAWLKKDHEKRLEAAKPKPGHRGPEVRANRVQFLGGSHG